MDTLQQQRLKTRAQSIRKFQELDPTEQEWLWPLLTKGIQTTLELLDIIADQQMTFQEIADELGISPITVSQKLNALAEGGYPIDIFGQSAFAPTGRPRKLARKTAP